MESSRFYTARVSTGETDSHPLVTIIVAVRNGIDTLAATLDSVLSQRGCAFELVVKDGQSEDGTLDLLQLRSQDDHRLRVLTGPDTGIPDAWNQAVAVARGSWVLFLGADDTFESRDTLAGIVPLLKATTADLVVGVVRMQGGPWHGKRLGGRPYNWAEMRWRNVLPHQGVFHGREFLNRVGPYDPRYPYAADYELLLRLGKALRVEWTDQIITAMGGHGLATRMATRVFQEWHRAQRQHRVQPPLMVAVWYARLRIGWVVGSARRARTLRNQRPVIAGGP
jgi:glycosyltransferase involved in cell wall biosynthesis